MATLGHTRLSWDNEKEKQPDSEDTAWAELTRKEQAAAVALGYTAAIWDNESGSEEQPTSADKYFAELESCGECLVILHDLALYPQGGGTERNAHATYWSPHACAPSRLCKRTGGRKSVGIHPSIVGQWRGALG